MTKLESYMVDGQFQATQFYAEVEGHPDDRSVQLALEELDYFTDRLALMGVFPADRRPLRTRSQHVERLTPQPLPSRQPASISLA